MLTSTCSGIEPSSCLLSSEPVLNGLDPSRMPLEELPGRARATAGEVSKRSLRILDRRRDPRGHGELQEREGVLVLPLEDRQVASLLRQRVVTGAAPAAAACGFVGIHGRAAAGWGCSLPGRTA